MACHSFGREILAHLMAIGIIIVEISLAFGFWSALGCEFGSWALGESSNGFSNGNQGELRPSRGLDPVRSIEMLQIIPPKLGFTLWFTIILG